VVIARCLDQIARAVERISDTAREIKLCNTGREQPQRLLPHLEEQVPRP
jgi:hypothetical protein